MGLASILDKQALEDRGYGHSWCHQHWDSRLRDWKNRWNMRAGNAHRHHSANVQRDIAGNCLRENASEQRRSHVLSSLDPEHNAAVLVPECCGQSGKCNWHALRKDGAELCRVRVRPLRNTATVVEALQKDTNSEEVILAVDSCAMARWSAGVTCVSQDYRSCRDAVSSLQARVPPFKQ